MIGQKDPLLIDVRAKEQQNIVKFKDQNNILQFPLSEMMSCSQEELKSKLGEGKLYVFCRSGINSVKATNYLKQKGFDAINIVGGLKQFVTS